MNTNKINTSTQSTKSTTHISSATVANLAGRTNYSVMNDIDNLNLPHKTGSFEGYAGKEKHYGLDKPTINILIANWSDVVKKLIQPKIDRLQNIKKVELKVVPKKVELKVEVVESKDLAVSTDQPKTMSSTQIAELTGKRHDNVKRTIEALMEKGIIRLTQIEESLINNGKIYNVSKRDSYVIVAQLSPKFTAQLVDRWQELEAPEPNDPVQALIGNAKQMILALEEAQPAVDFYKAVQDLPDMMSISEVAKRIGVGRNNLYFQLRADYILGGQIKTNVPHNLPYQKFIDLGYFGVKTFINLDGELESSPAVTTKGMLWLFKKYSPMRTHINEIG